MKRLFLWFKIRSLEATVSGREAVLPLVTDPLTRANMELATNIAIAEIRQLKREYVGY